MTLESAVVVLIPEADNLLETFRKHRDPSAAVGVPAHVTILYPFKAPAELTAETVSTLRELFASVPAFRVCFAETKCFLDVLYLAPVPDEPFRHLTEIVTDRFPDTPPYGGEFADVIPHLTVAQVDDPQQLEQIAAEFHLVARSKLPLRAEVQSVALMDNSSGQWQICAQFALRSDTEAS